MIAGISVALVLVPQALAYAELAGVPGYVGLYAATLPPIVAAAFASSRYLQTGPVALTGLLTFGAVAPLAMIGSEEYIRLVVLLALLVGAVRLVLGLAGLGDLAYFMSQPVLMGFTTSAAILIVASQLPTAFGLTPSATNPIVAGIDALTQPDAWHTPSVVVTAATVAVVHLGQRVGPRFPAVLLVVVGGLVLTAVSDFDKLLIGDVPAGFPPFSLDIPWSSTPALLVPGLVIAMIGFADAIAISRNFAIKDRERWNPDRELISQGAANLAAGVACGLPVGGSFSRSSLARLSGGRTRWTGAVAGIAVLAFLPFAGVLAELPRAVLAGVVIAAVVNLFDIRGLIRLISQSWGQSVVAWGTLLSTLALSPRIDIGVVIGVGLSVLVHLRRERRIRVDAVRQGTTLILRPSGVLFFGSAVRLNETLEDEVAAHRDIDTVLVDLRQLGRIDYTGAMALLGFLRDAEEAGLSVGVTNVPRHAAGTLERSWGDDLGGYMPHHPAAD